MILVIKTDEKTAYVGLWNKKKQELGAKSWEAGRELSNQILTVISELCNEVNAELSDLRGVITYEGPGSYTGLRIGISTVNAIAYSYDIPIVGSSGDSWLENGFKKLENITSFRPISPQYGGKVHTTKPKK